MGGVEYETVDRPRDKKTARQIAEQKLKNVVDQTEIINRMRKTTDGSFVYLAYAVPSNSELFNPYVLR